MPTNAAANAPNACDNAVRCGTAVIGIIAIGTPIVAPTANATRIHRYVANQPCSRPCGLSNNNVPPTAPQLRLIARAANAEGDVANAYFYMSYYYVSIGNLPLAIGQVRLALETPDVHDVDRARFRARLDELIEYLPDDQKELAERDGPQ